ncbi:hypothetical protein E1A91_A10G148700v1 [Gossypium mustelinum]|uniref:Uncharacterized protein n=1 Tax=Gossypium mustelinum TaxID=34275 RepID=A0A5D2XLQ9_GOSMU|nr:hypothetical protein E1A91_A10G148700v1 [Gossypium mustelinum]
MDESNGISLFPPNPVDFQIVYENTKQSSLQRRNGLDPITASIQLGFEASRRYHKANNLLQLCYSPKDNDQHRG